MKLLHATHSKTRVIGNTVDTGLFHNPNDADYYGPYVEYPVRYIVKVQICLLCFLWVTIWSATVDLQDSAAVDTVNKRANELADTLSCTGL